MVASGLPMLCLQQAPTTSRQPTALCNSHRGAQGSFSPPCAVQMVLLAKTSFEGMSMLPILYQNQESRRSWSHFWNMKASEQQVRAHSSKLGQLCTRKTQSGESASSHSQDLTLGKHQLIPRSSGTCSPLLSDLPSMIPLGNASRGSDTALI